MKPPIPLDRPRKEDSDPIGERIVETIFAVAIGLVFWGAIVLARRHMGY